MIQAAYYNENDTYCYYWLENLIKKRLIEPGDVDGRSIQDVPPCDVVPYRQAHFFAGIGVWSYALKKVIRLKDQQEKKNLDGLVPLPAFLHGRRVPRV
jgi:hypothetical protein